MSSHDSEAPPTPTPGSSGETPPLGSASSSSSAPAPVPPPALPASSEAEREADKEQLGQLFQQLSLQQPPLPLPPPSSSSSSSPLPSKQPQQQHPHVSYTPEDLRDLNVVSLRSSWPKFLDERFKNGSNRWDPDRWHSNTKKDGDEKIGGGVGGERPNSSMAERVVTLRDPKNRVKAAEQDGGGLVLSPQRRSFLTGCQIAAKDEPPPKPPGGRGGADNPRDSRHDAGGPGGSGSNRDRDDFNLRPEPQQQPQGPPGNRRVIGSGRLPNRDHPDASYHHDRDYDPQGERRKYEPRRGETNERFERGGGGGYRRDNNDYDSDPRSRLKTNDRWRDRDDDRERGNMMSSRGGRGGGRGGMDRRGNRYRREEVEPEWMSETIDTGGELMELRGFDDSPEKEHHPKVPQLQQHNSNTNGHGTRDNNGKQQNNGVKKEQHQPKVEPQQREPESNKVTDTNPNYNNSKPTKIPDMNIVSTDEEVLRPAGEAESIFSLETFLSKNLDDLLGGGNDPFLDGPKGGDAPVLHGSAAEGGVQEPVAVASSGPPQGSRFTQFFSSSSSGLPAAALEQQLDQKQAKQVAPDSSNSINKQLLKPVDLEEQRSSIQDELGQPRSIRIPSPTSEGCYFAPISPAAQTTPSQTAAGLEEQTQQTRPNPLMELLKGNGGAGFAPGAENSPANLGSGHLPPGVNLHHGQHLQLLPGVHPVLQGKDGVKSVEELEAKMIRNKQQHARQLQMKQQQQQQQQQQATGGSDGGDMSAFKKFAAMIGGPPAPQKTNSAESPVNGGGVKQQMSRSGLPQGGLVHGGSLHEQNLHQQQQHHFQQQQLQHHSQQKPGQRLPMGGNNQGEQQQQQPPPPPAGVPDLLNLIATHHMTKDCLNTPEAHTLRMAIYEGSVTPMSMLNQFVNGKNLGTVERDVLINYLKIMQQEGHLPTKMNPQIQQYLKIPPVVGPPPTQHAPHVGPTPPQQQAPPPLSPARGRGPPPPESLNLSMIKGQQNKSQQSLSPSMFGGGMSANSAGGPTNGGGGNQQLSVQATSPVQQRIPSPQELTIHAQQIMQNALIKRKLEEQKENYRKRNENSTSSNNSGSSSHLRDRSNSVGRSMASPAPSAVVAAAPTNFAFTPLSVMKKQAAERRDSDPKPLIPELRINQSEEAVAGIIPTQLQQQQHPRVSPSGIPQPQPVPLPHVLMQQQQQQQQLHHQQHQQQQQQLPFQNAHRAGGSGRFLPRHHPASGGPPQMIPPHHQQHGGGFMGGPLGALAGGGGGGGLSRFFSPEVLAQAHSGNAPTMPPLPTQKVLTLEEIERQAAAVRM